MKKVNVVAAIIESDGEILCMQRGKGKYDYISYKYEFPGGKVEPGESLVEALIREIDEEMDLKIEVSEQDFFMKIEHQYPDFHITMNSYRSKVKDRKFNLKEHHSFVWLKTSELKKLDWADADKPIIDKLSKEI